MRTVLIVSDSARGSSPGESHASSAVQLATVATRSMRRRQVGALTKVSGLRFIASLGKRLAEASRLRETEGVARDSGVGPVMLVTVKQITESFQIKSALTPIAWTPLPQAPAAAALTLAAALVYCGLV